MYRRPFADFLEQYLAPVPGAFVDVDTGQLRGSCPNILAVTHGQRAGIGGAAGRTFVVGKDVPARLVYVAEGHAHLALLADSALLRPAAWVAGEAPGELARGRALRCSYKARWVLRRGRRGAGGRGTRATCCCPRSSSQTLHAAQAAFDCPPPPPPG